MRDAEDDDEENDTRNSRSLQTWSSVNRMGSAAEERTSRTKTYKIAHELGRGRVESDDHHLSKEVGGVHHPALKNNAGNGEKGECMARDGIVGVAVGEPYAEREQC